MLTLGNLPGRILARLILIIIRGTDRGGSIIWHGREV